VEHEIEHVAPDVGQAQPVHDVADDQELPCMLGVGISVRGDHEPSSEEKVWTNRRQ
jgi:hypothetical protein